MRDNVTEAISGFEQDDFVKVKGVIHKYNGAGSSRYTRCAGWANRKSNT